MVFTTIRAKVVAVASVTGVAAALTGDCLRQAARRQRDTAAAITCSLIAPS